MLCDGTSDGTIFFPRNSTVGGVLTYAEVVYPAMLPSSCHECVQVLSSSDIFVITIFIPVIGSTEPSSFTLTYFVSGRLYPDVSTFTACLPTGTSVKT